MYEDNRRQIFYHKLQLVKNVNIDMGNARSFHRFGQFLNYALQEKTKE
ncbi:MAG: hypothetical protein GXP45_06975 [bacterium]|nr:hypothetical protein [bacterium]